MKKPKKHINNIYQFKQTALYILSPSTRMPSNEYLLLNLRFNKVQKLLMSITGIMQDYEAESDIYKVLSQSCRFIASESIELKKQIDKLKLDEDNILKGL